MECADQRNIPRRNEVLWPFASSPHTWWIEKYSLPTQGDKVQPGDNTASTGTEPYLPVLALSPDPWLGKPMHTSKPLGHLIRARNIGVGESTRTDERPLHMRTGHRQLSACGRILWSFNVKGHKNNSQKAHFLMRVNVRLEAVEMMIAKWKHRDPVIEYILIYTDISYALLYVFTISNFKFHCNWCYLFPVNVW